MEFEEFDWYRQARKAQPLSSRIPIYPDGSYERVVSDIESCGGKFRETLTRFLSSLALDVEVGSPSMASISELKRCFLRPNQEVIQLLLDCERGILAHAELFDFVTVYVDSSFLTLDICGALRSSIYRARDNLYGLEFALFRFERDAKSGGGSGKELYESTLRALKEFKAKGNNPYIAGFAELLECVRERQISLFVELKDMKSKLDKRFEHGKKGLRALPNAILLANFASVMVCSVLAMPRLVTPVAEAAAAAMPLANMDEWISFVWKKYEEEVQREKKCASCFRASIRKGDIRALVDKWKVEMDSLLLNDGFASRDEWINSVWHKYEKELDLQREMMSNSYFWTPMGKGDMDNIRALVDKLEVEMESVLLNDGFDGKDETDVMLAMDELKKKLSEFMNTVKDLSDHTVDCCNDVMDWRNKYHEISRSWREKERSWRQNK